MSLYFQSQWTPLILFFLMYLYVIRNTKLHHFMRFYCMQVSPSLRLCNVQICQHWSDAAKAALADAMCPCLSTPCLPRIALQLLLWPVTLRDTRCGGGQAIMVDIITMLFTLVRQYFPAEFRWSPLQDVFDIFTFSMVMFTILYCMFFALRCSTQASVPAE